MFIAGSYMLYSSHAPSFSSVAVPCTSPAITTTCTPPPFSVSAFTATPPVMSSVQPQNRTLEPADLSHLKKVTGFSVSDILERDHGSAPSMDEDFAEKPKTAACVVVTPSSPSLKRRRLRGGMSSFSSMSSVSPSSSSSSSSSGPSTPLSLPPSPTFSPNSPGVDMPQDLSSAIPAPKLSQLGHSYSSQASLFSHQLKFGVDRILSDDLTPIGRRDVPSSCTVCVSPFSHPLPTLPPQPPPPTTLRCRTSGVPCECMHPLCDGSGLFPTLYTYSSLPYPACAIYPNTHLSSERDTSSGGPHLHHQNSYHHHPSSQNQGSGKRKRSWSRAVFSNLQRKGLEKRFQIQKYITKPDRRQLAATLGLTDAQVKVWFQNRRMKWRHSKEAKEEFAKQATAKAAEEQQNNNKTTEIHKVATETKDAARTKSID